MRSGDRVPRVSLDTPMPEAIHEMTRKMMDITAVVDAGDVLAGVISDGDLRRLLENDAALLSRTAGACLHPNPEDRRRGGVRLDRARPDGGLEDHFAVRRRLRADG